MKRFIAVIMVLSLILNLSSVVFADTIPLPHVSFGNLIKLAGGNKDTMFMTPHEFGNYYNYLYDIYNDKPSKYKTTDGFDMKGDLVRIYRGEVTGLDPSKLDEDDKFILGLLKAEGEILPKNNELKTLLPYRKFDEAAWADMKFRLLPDGNKDQTTVVVLGEKRSTKPVDSKTVPTTKDALLNPNAPIVMTTFDNRLVVGVDDIYKSSAIMKLLDSKGNVIGSTKITENINVPEGTPSYSTINIPNGRAKYYLEYYEDNKYCYLLLDIKVDPTKPKENKTITAAITKAIREMKKAGQQGEKVAQDYMTQKGITDTGQLTETDKQAIAEEYTKKYAPAGFIVDQMKVINDYMKEHGIKSMTSLKDKDMQIISGLVFKNSVLSWPPEYVAMVDDYMAKHNIAKYEDLREKDMNALAKLIKQKQAAEKKSSTKKTKKK